MDSLLKYATLTSRIMRLFRQRLIKPLPLEAKTIKHQPELFNKLLRPVPDHGEQVPQLTINVIVGLNINMVGRNQRQQCLKQIVLSANVGEEAEPSQHEVGMTN